MASNKKNKAIDNQESINKVEGSGVINESNKEAIKKKGNIKKGVEEKKESSVGKKKVLVEGESSKKSSKVSLVKKSKQKKDSKLSPNLADNKSIDKKVGKKSEKSTVKGRDSKKAGFKSKVDSKKEGERKKRKLSDYNLVQRAAWQLLREQGFKGGFKEGCKKVLGVYKDWKALPESSKKKENIGRVVDGLLITSGVVAVKISESDEEVSWFSFMDALGSLKEVNPEYKIRVIADDSQNFGGNFTIDTNVSDLRSEIRSSDLWKYLNRYPQFRKSPLPVFVLTDYDNNEALYEVNFFPVDTSIPAKDDGNGSGVTAPAVTGEQQIKLAEIDKDKKAIELEILKEQNKQNDYYKQLFDMGIITKEEFRAKLGLK